MFHGSTTGDQIREVSVSRCVWLTHSFTCAPSSLSYRVFPFISVRQCVDIAVLSISPILNVCSSFCLQSNPLPHPKPYRFFRRKLCTLFAAPFSVHIQENPFNHSNCFGIKM